jgi:hypothetical protein
MFSQSRGANSKSKGKLKIPNINILPRNEKRRLVQASWNSVTSP